MEYIDYEQHTQSFAVSGTKEENKCVLGESNESGEVEGAEENHGMFRNDAPKSVSSHHSVVSRDEKRKGAYTGGILT